MKSKINSRPRLLMLLALFLAATLPLVPQKVRVDWDRHSDFSNYKTYSWGRIVTMNSLWDDRVRSAIDEQLAAKGWMQVPEGGDATVMAVQMTQEKPTLETFYNGFGGWGWRGFGGMGIATTTVENYKEGTLVVDIFDTNTQKLIWRGVGEEALSDKSDKNIKVLNKVVAKLFEHFPPSALG